MGKNRKQTIMAEDVNSFSPYETKVSSCMGLYGYDSASPARYVFLIPAPISIYVVLWAVDSTFSTTGCCPFI